MTLTNQDRAENGQRALDEYMNHVGVSDVSERVDCFVDLLADLIHLTDLEPELVWDEAVERAFNHYGAEIRDREKAKPTDEEARTRIVIEGWPDGPIEIKSPRAAAGILRRSAAHGLDLPDGIRTALEALASKAAPTDG